MTTLLTTIFSIAVGIVIITLLLPAIFTYYVVGKWDWAAIKKVYIMVCLEHKDKQ